MCLSCWCNHSAAAAAAAGGPSCGTGPRPSCGTLQQAQLLQAGALPGLQAVCGMTCGWQLHAQELQHSRVWRMEASTMSAMTMTAPQADRLGAWYDTLQMGPWLLQQ